MQKNSLPGPPGGARPQPIMVPPRRVNIAVDLATPAEAPATVGVPLAVQRQRQADMEIERQATIVLRSRQFRDLRFRMNNYFAYHRRGLVAEHERELEKPWDAALWDPSKALAPYNPPQLPQDWNDLYNPFGFDDEAYRGQQAANTLPFMPPFPGFIRPSNNAGGRHNIFYNIVMYFLVRSGSMKQDRTNCPGHNCTTSYVFLNAGS